MQYTDYEVAEILQDAGVAAIPTLKGDMVSRDPHIIERDLFEEIEHPELGKRFVVGPPWKLSATPAKIRRPAPLLGEHNQYVLGELLGMTQSEIDRLIEEEVVN
jgi:crotonobetainyl-CoA:carnitine CoA-transferase CaiB-like acyl-CoA transferase